MELRNVGVAALAAAAPKNYIDNEKYLETDDSLEKKRLSKIIKMTGIRHRHTVAGTGVRLVDLAVEATREALRVSGIDKESIKAVVYVTQMPEIHSPSTAFIVQKELDIPMDCMAFDVNLGCSGFVGGLGIAAGILALCSDKDHVIMINAEQLSTDKRANANDELLFGDAASCIILRYDESGVIPFEYRSDGRRYDVLYKEKKDSEVYMDGEAVFQFTINEVAELIRDFIVKYRQEGKYDFCVLHQAQLLIMKNVAQRSGIPTDKLLVSLDEYANTSGASIPLSICYNKKRLKSGKNEFLISGYGIGLSFGVAKISIDKESIADVLEI